MKKVWLCSFLLVGILSFGWAQNSRDVGPRVPAVQYQAVKKQKKERRFFFFKKKKKSEVEAFRERVSESYAENRKEQKLAEKPQYSDPLYFGHKKQPKKRPLGKRKFCKECGLVH